MPNKLRLFNNLRRINSVTLVLKANITICQKHLDENMLRNDEVKKKKNGQF